MLSEKLSGIRRSWLHVIQVLKEKKSVYNGREENM